MIIASAIMFVLPTDNQPIVIMGKRHHVCFERAWNLGLRRPYVDYQGFWTNDDRFLDRNEAYQYAIDCGQIEKTEHPGILYSEDLW